MKEVDVAFRLVILMAFIIVLATGLLRFLVPSILEAHFYGSVLLASIVGILGVVALLYITVFLARKILRPVMKADEDGKGEVP